MTRRRYLRAYMAGVSVSALFFLLVIGVSILIGVFFAKGMAGKEPKVRPETAAELVVFTMVLVPNFFGFWDMLYVALRRRTNWSLGLHGALAPFVILPIGVLHARMVHQFSIVPGGIVQFGQTLTYGHLAVIFSIEIVIYYLVWKYIVGFFNRTVDLPS